MRVRTNQRTRRGVAAAEVAILLPFLVFTFAVAADFCRVFYATQTLQGCARTGALYASGTVWWDKSRATATEMAQQAAVADGVDLDPPLTADDVTVTLDATAATVTVTHEFRTLLNCPGIPGTWTLTRSVRMNLAPKPPGAR